MFSVTKRGDLKLVFIVALLISFASFIFVSAVNETQGNVSINATVNSSFATVLLNASLNTTTNAAPNESQIAAPTVQNITTTIAFIVKDSKGKEISSQAKAIKKITTETKIRKLKNSKQTIIENVTHEDDVVEVTPVNSPVKNVDFRGLAAQTGTLGIDDVPETIPSPKGKWAEVYAIDPTALNFTNASVTVTAKGSQLLKCKEWDFAAQKCNGDWAVFKSITPGRDYTFLLTKDDPGFGEIVATAAIHMDENYTVLGDIYDKIKAKDNLWSGPVYQNQIVRVTFDQNLTNGRLIDVLANSNNTYSYFDVYEAGTQHKVGSSGVITNPELVYVTVDDLTQPTNVFDFKIMSSRDPNATWENQNTTPFIDYDYIHDDAINSTTAKGIIGYSEQSAGTPAPRYRLWNTTNSQNNFSAEFTAQTIGKKNVTWVIVRGIHERDEIIMGTESKANAVNIQVFNRTKKWFNQKNVSTNIPNSGFRAFDIAVEDVSGRAMFVYENVSAAATDNSVFFRFWNGTGYTAQQTLTTKLNNSKVNWVLLDPKPGSDDIMLLVENDGGGLRAIPWNGSAFDQARGLNLTLASSAVNKVNFGFGWEKTDKQGFVVYGTGTTLAYRTYNGSAAAANVWGSQNTFGLSGSTLNAVRLCPDQTSNDVGVIWQTAGTVVNASIWNGTVRAFVAGAPSGDTASTISGTNTINVACAWQATGGVALFGYIDTGALTAREIRYFNFTKAGSAWSTATLTGGAVTANIPGVGTTINMLRFTPHPTSKETMAVVISSNSQIFGLRWSGTAWGTAATLETVAGTAGNQASAFFDWYRFDPMPSVFNVAPTAGKAFNISNSVTVAANVTDNIAVGKVTANVTKPGGTITILNLTNTGTRYTATFTGTTNKGSYSVKFIANDTSIHRNYNKTVTTSFVVNDVVKPAVFDAFPRPGSAFSTAALITVAANVTDDLAVSQVKANISRPGNVTILRLKLSTANRYNNTFRIPNVTGRYNVTFIANDTSNNVNKTTKTNFTVTETVKPAVFDVRPRNASIFNVTNLITVSANVTDNIAVSQVFANISRPTLGFVQLRLKLGTANRYNNTFRIPNATGLYNITFDANDTSNNHNTSRRTVFRANDRIKPSVFDAFPRNATVFNLTNLITVKVNVTDNIAVSQVMANISKPGGLGFTQIRLKLGTANRYNNTFRIPNATGRYNITFDANDTSNNHNVTTRTTFRANEIVHPVETGARPLNGSVFNVTNRITVSANVSDILPISTVFGNITYPNGGFTQLTLKFSSGIKYNNTFAIPNVTGRYNITFDSADIFGLHNTSLKTSFRANDITKPAVFDVRPRNASIFNVTNLITVSANATDNIAVSQVIANISRPTLGLTQLRLKLGTANRYNNTFRIPNATGRYNITFDTNDTSNNRNVSRKTTFRANDRIKPSVFDAFPRNATIFNETNLITISANATDNIAVSQVIANITRPTLGLVQLRLKLGTANHYNNTFRIPNATGRYNITFDTNDTSNNRNVTTRTTFRANDRTRPTVFDAFPRNATIFNVTNLVTIRVNVTDNIAISQVFANLSRPSLGLLQIRLKLSTANRYNNTFRIPNITGRYNITFDANDTSNNHNVTTRTTFRANDITKPAVFDVRPRNATIFNVTNLITIAANATDNIAVSQVIANISRPTFGLVQLRLKLSTANRYNNTFRIPNATGRYNITFDTNDTSNNRNVTTRTTFRANDITKPAVFDAFPRNASIFNVTNMITIAANATDNIAVSQVFANITRPTLGLLHLRLKLSTANRYNSTFTIPNITGIYNITFDANDTSNNHNVTTRVKFRANDRVRPTVFDVRPRNATIFNVTNLITIAANATDNIAVSQVIANISRPTFGLIQLRLKLGTANHYNNTFRIPNATGRYNITFDVNDTSNNRNVTTRTTFRANDNLRPTVFDVFPRNASIFNVTNLITIAANATDNIAVSQVIANITRPKSGLLQLRLKLGTANHYNNTFRIPNATGIYNITFDANDTSNNHNTSRRTTFRANDRTLPSVIIVSPDLNSIFSPRANVTIKANVTDNIAVSQVFSNVTQPNGSIVRQRLIFSSTDFYNTTFNKTQQTGTYTIRIIANDTSNNVNRTVTRTFTIQDATRPVVHLINPNDASLLSRRNVTFTCNATDDVALSNITFYHNIGQAFGKNKTTVVAGKYNVTNFTISNIADGSYRWNCRASDTSSNLAFAPSNFTFTVDKTAPNVTDVRPRASSIFNVTSKIEIAANVSDRSGVSIVRANITRPGGVTVTKILTLVTGSKYNVSFTIPNITGLYNVTFFANDTLNNVNRTVRTNFTARDRTRPSVFDAFPRNATVYNITNLITIAANVTDNIAVSQVFANISRPTFGLLHLQLKVSTANRYNNTFRIPNATGRYNITFDANDTSNNHNTTTRVTFRANDNVKPAVFDAFPRNASIFNVTNRITIAANVTDNIAVSQVFANISRPTFGLLHLRLKLSTTNHYNNTFTIPNATGIYNITFDANDTGNNHNVTTRITFRANDRLRPAVFDVRPRNATTYNITNMILIAANVTDNIAVSKVFANITRPGGTVTTLTLKPSTANRYNNTFTIPNITGRYNVTFLANDTSNNQNFTVRTTFNAVDRFKPAVFDVRPRNASVFNVTNMITIAANVTNHIGVSKVFANITRPGGLGLFVLELKLGTANRYNNTFTIPNITGRYNITFDANDTSNNHNATVRTTFRANDRTRPSVFDAFPRNASIFNVTNRITIAANVTDNIAVSQVFANISRPTFGLLHLRLKLSTANRYNNTFRIPNATGRYNITFDTNDTSNNRNVTTRTTFRANDITKPTVFDVRPRNASTFNVTNLITVSANATDNIAVSQVIANITRPTFGLTQLRLKLGTANRYNNTFRIPNATGLYNITFDSNDTSNNRNVSRRTTFRANDRLKPTVFDAFPRNASIFNVTNVIIIAANVTDNIAVSQVYANISRPSLGLLHLRLKVSTANRYNNTFTIPNVTGIYNVTFDANDTSNNHNVTTRVKFRANDRTRPSVFDAFPRNGSVVNMTQKLVIATNVTDNIAVSQVYANISRPSLGLLHLRLKVSTANRYNNTFTVPNISGIYNVTFDANDTSNNHNTTITTTFRANDTIKPVVSNVRPLSGSLFNISRRIQISANVTDNVAVSVVKANITFPNGTKQIRTLIFSSNNKYNLSFLIPNKTGVYRIQFITNDTNDNVNRTVRTNFTARDVTPPVITIGVCRPSNGNLTNSIFCNATVTDNIGISIVRANVTRPQGGGTQVQSVSNISSVFFFTFTNTTKTGRYNVTWRANDTSSSKQTATTSFNISDRIKPGVVLNAPINHFNSSRRKITFNFTATDNFDLLLSCSLRVDSIITNSSTSVANGTPKVFKKNSFTQGTHTWNVTCNDDSGNSNTTSSRVFTVDTFSPIIVTINTQPSSADDLDPGKNITVFAQVTDNVTGVHTVELQRKLQTETRFVNTTMTLNTSINQYVSQFNATSAGTYNLRIRANDTVNNTAFSSVQNISVEFERTWSRTPSSFTPVVTTPDSNVTLGVLNITNIGDVTLNFSIRSNFVTTIFNDTANFTLQKSRSKFIMVNDTAPASGTKNIVLNISALNGTPHSRTTTGSIVVTNQPLLVASFTNPSSDILTVDRGQTNIPFTLLIKNVGNSNATNVTIKIVLPPGITVTFGSPNLFIGQLDSGLNATNSIEVTAPTSLAFGNYTVIGNSTGQNATGGDLGTQGLIFSKKITLEVTTPPPSNIGGGGGHGGGGATTSPTVTGGGGGGGAVSQVTSIIPIATPSLFTLLSGALQGPPLTISNNYENAVMENLIVEAEGFLSQYIDISPIIDLNKLVHVETQTINIGLNQVAPFTFAGLGIHTITTTAIGDNFVTFVLRSEPQIVTLQLGQTQDIDLDGDGKLDVAVELAGIVNGKANIKVHKLGPPDPNKLYFGEDRQYNFKVFAPPYLQRAEYNITIRIVADLVAINPQAANFTTKKIVMYRNVVFKIIEIPPEKVEAAIRAAHDAVDRMASAGFPTTRLRALVTQAEQAYLGTQYELALKTAEQAVTLVDDAFTADNLIKDIEQGIQEAHAKMLATTQTENALALTKAAFEREDFETALSRAKQTRLTFFLETRGRVNPLYFLRAYWWAVVLVLTFGSLFVFALYRQMRVSFINRRLNALNREETTINGLIKEAQTKRFKTGTLSAGQYSRLLEQYNARLDELNKTRVNLRGQRGSLMKPSKEVMIIEQEERDIKDMMRKTQRDYLEKKSLTRERFEDIYGSEKRRLADLEKEKDVLKTEIQLKHDTWWYSVQRFFRSRKRK